MLKIIFENEHLIVVDKPAGVLSVPSRFQDKDARPFAAQFIKHIPHKNLFPIHRLDFEVSGLLLFAKTPGAQKVVSDAFEKHTVVKTYEALTEINGDFAHAATPTMSVVRGKDACPLCSASYEITLFRRRSRSTARPGSPLSSWASRSPPRWPSSRGCSRPARGPSACRGPRRSRRPRRRARSSRRRSPDSPSFRPAR